MTCYHFHFAEDKPERLNDFTWGHTARKLQNQGSDTSCLAPDSILKAKHLVRLYVCLTSCILSLSYLTCKMEFLPPTSRSSLGIISSRAFVSSSILYSGVSTGIHSLPMRKGLFSFLRKKRNQESSWQSWKAQECLLQPPFVWRVKLPPPAFFWSRSNK